MCVAYISLPAAMLAVLHVNVIGGGGGGYIAILGVNSKTFMNASWVRLGINYANFMSRVGR